MFQGMGAAADSSDIHRRRVARAEKIIQDLSTGRLVMDLLFDQVFPAEVQSLSGVHWTPVRVARRAAQLLVASDRTRVLDVGSGCGKLCILGALITPGQFTGIEQRGNLVGVAQGAASALGAERASFIHGDMRDLVWDSFDSFYFFNPFYEHQVPGIAQDDSLALCAETFGDYVEVVQSKLKNLRAGTRVVTYHGLGGPMPYGYHRVLREPAGSDVLELWVKRRPHKRRKTVANSPVLA